MTMSEEWISNSGEVEATMAGIEDEKELGGFDSHGNPIDEEECDPPKPGEIFFDEDGNKWIMGMNGEELPFTN